MIQKSPVAEFSLNQLEGYAVEGDVVILYIEGQQQHSYSTAKQVKKNWIQVEKTRGHR